MARVKKQPVEVQKFGGVDELGKVQMDGHVHDAASIETKSDTKLEDDLGVGRPVIMRSFTFKINAQAFMVHVPTKQELFDSHLKGIEIALWRDGLAVDARHDPHLLFNKQKTHYTIFIVATPAKGHILTEKPRTLTEIAHDTL